MDAIKFVLSCYVTLWVVSRTKTVVLLHIDGFLKPKTPYGIHLAPIYPRRRVHTHTPTAFLSGERWRASGDEYVQLIRSRIEARALDGGGGGGGGGGGIHCDAYHRTVSVRSVVHDRWRMRP